MQIRETPGAAVNGPGLVNTPEEGIDMSNRTLPSSWKQVEEAAREIAQNLETMARMQRTGAFEVTSPILLAVATAARDIETGARRIADALDPDVN